MDSIFIKHVVSTLFIKLADRQELAAAVAAEGLRPILASDTPRELAALLEAAWQLQPAARPSAEHLEAELRALLHSMESAPAASPSDCDGAANGNGRLVHSENVILMYFLVYTCLVNNSEELERDV